MNNNLIMQDRKFSTFFSRLASSVLIRLHKLFNKLNITINLNNVIRIYTMKVGKILSTLAKNKQ